MTNRRPNDEPYTDETIPMRRPAAHLPPARQPRDVRVPPPGSPPPRRPPARVRPPLAVPPRRTGAARWLRRLLLLLVGLLVVALVGTLVFQQRIANKVKLADVRTNRPPAGLLVTPMNILLLGVDLREDYPEEGIRSDTLILLHLDPAGGWGSMLSIPRDSVATIPDFGEAKINTAFARGYENAADLYGDGTDPTAAGAALAARTVEDFLGLRDHNARIDYVATINFNGFARLIDAVGGVDVDVPREIVDTEYPTEDFGTTTIRIPAGRQHLDGTTALQYVRTRHADSDFGRAQRQQQVIRALVAALREKPALLRPLVAMQLVDAASSASRTTMPVGRPDALVMVALLSRVDPGRVGQFRIDPERVGVQEFGSDLVWNRADLAGLVSEALSPPGEAQEAATVQVQNAVGIGGIAGRVTDLLAEQRFSTATPADAEPSAESKIIDYGEHPATSERLSAVLGGMPVVAGSSMDVPPGVDIVVLLGEDYDQYVAVR